MRVVDPAAVKVHTDDHPTGALGIRYLLQGRPRTPEMYVMSVAENLGRFDMVRHRHNFDQFRFPIAGDMSMGNGRKLKAGHLGYFPEGTAYGPQGDDAGPVCFVLQFGGASGYGFMGPEQYRAGRAALKQSGRFEGPVYIREQTDGGTRKTFSINAIWEEEMGSKMLLPAPRYDEPIFMNPRAFRWIPVPDAPGISRKTLGVFSEREVKAEMILLGARSRFTLPAGEAFKLLFVLSGVGTAGAARLKRHGAVELAPGESALLGADDEPVTLLAFTLPLINESWRPAEIESIEPIPGEAVTVEV